MADLKLVRGLEPYKEAQKLALYVLDGRHIVVSTVNLDTNRATQDIASTALVGLAGSLGGYATSGEETMAFPADATGEITDWGEVACATGDGSRRAVIQQLEADGWGGDGDE